MQDWLATVKPPPNQNSLTLTLALGEHMTGQCVRIAKGIEFARQTLAAHHIMSCREDGRDEGRRVEYV